MCFSSCGFGVKIGNDHIFDHLQNFSVRKQRKHWSNMGRFSGIYGLYVNNCVQKTYKNRFGCKPPVRVLKISKTPKPLENTDYFGTTPSPITFNFGGGTTCLTTYEKIQYFSPFRGVAQLVARQFRVLEAASSSPATSTNKKESNHKGCSLFYWSPKPVG